MAGHDAKGRSKGDGRFIRVFHHMLNTDAGQSLTPHEMAALIRIMQRYNGDNNGRISMSSREAAKQANMNKNTAAKALKSLVNKGFLVVRTPSGFNQNGRKAAEYEITCFSPGLKKPAKNSFQDWRSKD